MLVKNPPLLLQLRLSCRLTITLVITLLASLLWPSSALPAGSGPSGGWTDAHCGSCHQTDTLFSHPVDIDPTMAVPSGLPLVNGQVVCITCHDSDSSSHAMARGGNSAMLRGGMTVAQLCGSCPNAMELSRTAQHGTNLDRAHIYWPATRNSRRPVASEATTQLCLSCHDGLISRDAGGSNLVLASGVMAEHPLGVSMKTAFSDVALRAPEFLDSRIRLANNSVQCLSCHSPYSKENRQLVMSNHRSALCLNCHIQ